MTAHGYRQHLRTVVAASAAPYGYTLTLWTAGAVTTHANGDTLPTTLDALLLLAGAALGFVVVATVAFGHINGVLEPGTVGLVRIWGGMHLPSVGASILLVSLLVQFFQGHWVWAGVGFTSTATYLLVIGAQFWLATHRRQALAPGTGQELEEERED